MSQNVVAALIDWLADHRPQLETLLARLERWESWQEATGELATMQALSCQHCDGTGISEAPPLPMPEPGPDRWEQLAAIASGGSVIPDLRNADRVTVAWPDGYCERLTWSGSCWTWPPGAL